MYLAAITFPDIDPVLVQIGPFSLRWYALAYIAGLLLGWLYCIRLAQNTRLWRGAAPITRIELDDLLIWVTMGIILGGRLGYVLFYNLSFYMSEPLQIIAVWRGGMSFHGGLVGAVLAVLLFARRRGIVFLSIMDLVAAAAPIGLFFGRVANFINAELYGRPSDVAWAVIFPLGDNVPRHPSQLYEAGLEGLVLFIALRLLITHYRALAKPGLVSGAFLAGYGAARIFVEFFRMPDAQIGYLWGSLTMGMLLSVPLVLLGAFLISRARGEHSTSGM